MATATPAAEVRYDPYDVDIDDNPYPTWKRLRDQAPLYRNEEHDFFALSRWDDVKPALADWKTYRSGRGTVLEIIRADVEIPPGILLFEDPPLHDAHRALLSRVFTPRRMLDLEPLVREYCTSALDALVERDEFDIVGEFGIEIPLRTMGFLFGIPHADQLAYRRRTDDALATDGTPISFDQSSFDEVLGALADYVDWRSDNPGDDLMTELLNAQVDQPDGTRRPLTREEVITYASMVAGAGNETATRLIGFTMQLLAQHPGQRRLLVDNPSLIPNAIEEILRLEAPSPVQARYVQRDVEVHGTTVPEGSTMLLLNGAANRDERHFSRPDTFDVHRAEGPHISFGYGLHFCLGAALARLEGRVALEEILRRWRGWDVDTDRGAMAHTASVRGWGYLPVRPHRTTEGAR
ncbi:cytochrome P450 [Cryptosporangium aurantiacum]|uniref:Cytochrome P450 n=1 Tax=Cryptosporangium aurantiacum TaxID=134849 RepID=A0A1M7Q1X7_9ACTN|nr:cytochrome P450 [Cryptosporangium aurantiacum]SHN24185.1 Cytochrome P450 [Cryptosporangium aurantiacum]